MTRFNCSRAPIAAKRIVELRYFAGLEIDETAEVLEISPATVKRDWLIAKAFLKREMLRGARRKSFH